MTSRRPLTCLALLAATSALSACQTMGRKPLPPAPAAEPVTTAPAAAAPQAAPAVRAPPAPAVRTCVPRSLAPPPRYPDTDAALRAAAGAADRYQLMAAGRILRQQRLQDLERVIAGCR